MTCTVSKQLLPVFDKPMIYYPLSTLMLSHIREVLIISTPHDLPNFRKLLGDGTQWGMEFHYTEQPVPGGLAQAFLLGEAFLQERPSALILGDNIFYGHSLTAFLGSANERARGATIFSYRVKDPERYGVATLDSEGHVIRIEEKPSLPCSCHAITGLYFYDSDVVAHAKTLVPSVRGELEITDLNQRYLESGMLYVEQIGRGHTWLDAGTSESLLEANQFIQTIQHRQNMKVACPEEIAYRAGWIDSIDMERLIDNMNDSDYGKYLLRLLED